jgi:IS1 family transposase
MPNILPVEKQVSAISALAEGSSIRSVERMTGIHRDTVMRLAVRVGKACARLLDETMRALPCNRIEVDEIWGFIGRKQATVKPEDPADFGDVWTYVAIDPETKAVPAFAVGKRDFEITNRFVSDVSVRMAKRIQISSDALNFYVAAVENGFGGEVDYGQVVKTYRAQDIESQRRYSPSQIQTIRRQPISGNPREEAISTSIVERQNFTMRMHMRRLTRLTNGFSKKLENFKAAVALHYGYYNYVRVHSSIRMTPAMAVGAASKIWTVEDLVCLDL